MWHVYNPLVKAAMDIKRTTPVRAAKLRIRSDVGGVDILRRWLLGGDYVDAWLTSVGHFKVWEVHYTSTNKQDCSCPKSRRALLHMNHTLKSRRRARRNG